MKELHWYFHYLNIRSSIYDVISLTSSVRLVTMWIAYIPINLKERTPQIQVGPLDIDSDDRLEANLLQEQV